MAISVIRRLAYVLTDVRLDGQEITASQVKRMIFFYMRCIFLIYGQTEKLNSFIKRVKYESKILHYCVGYDNFGRVVFHKCE